MHWYCWKILLKTSARARKIHELSFVSGIDLIEKSAINRAKVALFMNTHDEKFMDAIVVQVNRLGPYATIQEAAIDRDIPLVTVI